MNPVQMQYRNCTNAIHQKKPLRDFLNREYDEETGTMSFAHEIAESNPENIERVNFGWTGNCCVQGAVYFGTSIDFVEEPDTAGEKENDGRKTRRLVSTVLVCYFMHTLRCVPDS